MPDSAQVIYLTFDNNITQNDYDIQHLHIARTGKHIKSKIKL